MSAVSETLDVEFERNNISKPECHRVDPTENNKGLLTGQIPKNFKSGRKFTLLEFLYIDDGAFVFRSRADLTRTENYQKSLRRFWFRNAHRLINGEASKTECDFYPTSAWFCETTPPILLQADPETDPDLFDEDLSPHCRLLHTTNHNSFQRQQIIVCHHAPQENLGIRASPQEAM
eukprot:scaffold54358_cov36-Cyclotella_meneghiniana.AAC.8